MVFNFVKDSSINELLHSKNENEEKVMNFVKDSSINEAILGSSTSSSEGLLNAFDTFKKEFEANPGEFKIHRLIDCEMKEVRPTLSLSEFETLVNSRPIGCRKGQEAFNILFNHNPGLANEVLNHEDEIDPFYNDDKLDAFILFLIEKGFLN